MRAAFGNDGFLVQEAVLAPAEGGELRDAVEQVSAAVTARARRQGAGPEVELADGHRIQFSSRTSIQWEWTDGSEQIRLLEPCDHLHPLLAGLFADERLTGPVCEALGSNTVEPFTSKLNFKRAQEGSEFPYHQDYPYWYVSVGERAQDVITAIVFLDDATAGNGAVRAVPGSHLAGPVRRDLTDPTRFLTDPTAVDRDAEIVIEVPAGSVLWFGAFLVHRSSPNTTGGHRRALLPSWQPPGRPLLRDASFQPELVDHLP